MEEDTKSPLRAVFEDAVPMPFLHDTVRMLVSAYLRAGDHCRPFSREVAHDLIGHERRGYIEENWPAIARRAGGHSEYRPNRKGSAYHAEVRFGRVILTESHVETPETIIRRAEFRNTLARPNQLRLWDNPAPPLPSDPLFGVLIHGTASAGSWGLGFAHVVFPDQECEPDLARIDLFELCHAAVRDLTNNAVDEEVVPDQAAPTLRAQDLRDV